MPIYLAGRELAIFGRQTIIVQAVVGNALTSSERS
jgi:hypothetical protein